MAHEPAWAKGLREATSAFMAARGQTVQEDLAYRQDARAANADQRAMNADSRAERITQSGLHSEELDRQRARQQIQAATENARRQAQAEALALQERKDIAAIRSGSLDTLIDQADDPEVEARLGALQSVLPNLSPEAGAILMEEADKDFKRAGVRKSVERVRAELGRATRAAQGEDPLIDPKDAKSIFSAVESYVQTGEGMSPDDALAGIVQARLKRAESKYEMAMTQRLFGKIAEMIQLPGFASTTGVEEASKVMAQAAEFPPENKEQRSKLWSKVVGALMETEQRTVKVLGRDFEDVSGWAQGGRIPNVRQLAEMRLIAASLLAQSRNQEYTEGDAETRARMEDERAKSLAASRGWQAWPVWKGNKEYEAISGPYAGMKTTPKGQPLQGGGAVQGQTESDLAPVAQVLASGGDANAVHEALVKAGLDPYKITPEQKAKIRELAERNIGRIAPGKSTGTGGK